VELRIKDNSVRLRLDRSDVDALRERGEIASSTVFPGGRTLRFRVESSPASVAPTALFSDNVLTVRWHETEILRWVASEQTSLQGEQTLADGERLAVLVEKDFDDQAAGENAEAPNRDRQPGAGAH
jgi:hypothetical protein